MPTPTPKDAKQALYAVAGAADLAVSALRHLPAEAAKLRARLPGEAAKTYGAVNLATATGLALKVLDGAPRARGAALLAALRALDWLDDAEWDAVIGSATVDIHGGGHPVGAVRPAKLTLSRPD